MKIFMLHLLPKKSEREGPVRMLCSGVFRVLFTGIFLFVLCGPLGCSESKEMTDPKGELVAKATEYWNKRLMEKDYKAIYPMEMEEETLSYNEYLKRVRNAGQIVYMSIKINDVKVEGDKGEVTVEVMGTVAPEPIPVPMSALDHWVVDKKKWKHVLRKRTKK